MRKDQGLESPRWMPRLFLGSAALVLTCATVWSAGQRLSLEILSEKTLSAQLTTPTDVRWASDRSVYLSRLEDGVAEVDLATLDTRRQVIPASKALNGFTEFGMLGVSGGNMVTSARFRNIAVRRLGRKFDNGANLATLPIGLADAIDVSGDRLLLLGLPQAEVDSGFGPRGVIAWLGPIDGLSKKDLLQPILPDVAGPGARSFGRCATIPLGAARFLGDGTALVVPGVQPGIHLYDRSGSLVRSWDSQKVGIDTIDCAGMDTRASRHLRSQPSTRAAFLNSHHVVDDILPLAEGPGLVVRHVEAGKVRWSLEILQSGNRVASYEIPISGTLPFERLRGDVRGDRIVLLISEHEMEKDRPQNPARLLLARLPGTGAREGK
jgi:hypothetical protein